MRKPDRFDSLYIGFLILSCLNTDFLIQSTVCIQVFSSSTALSHDQSSPPETTGKRHSWGRVLRAGQGLWAGQPGTGRSWVRILCLVGTGLLLLLFRIHLLQVGKKRSKKKVWWQLAKATCHTFQIYFYSIVRTEISRCGTYIICGVV